MLVIEVVKCSSTDHKIKCLNEVREAVERTKHGNMVRNGRKVTIRGAITDPCTCHLDAALWIIQGTRSNGFLGSEAWVQGFLDTEARAELHQMH